VILRRDYRTATFPVSAFHYRFLQQVEKHRNVAEALERMAEWSERPLKEVLQSWRDEVKGPWIEAGFFVHRKQDVDVLSLAMIESRRTNSDA
jgi:hypothetical protein